MRGAFHSTKTRGNSAAISCELLNFRNGYASRGCSLFHKLWKVKAPKTSHQVIPNFSKNSYCEFHFHLIAFSFQNYLNLVDWFKCIWEFFLNLPQEICLSFSLNFGKFRKFWLNAKRPRKQANFRKQNSHQPRNLFHFILLE